MCDMARPYVQRTRAESARQTRAQVLTAAREAILGDGRLEFSVGDIADRAGVARSTVYAAFGRRRTALRPRRRTLHRAGLEGVIAAYQQEDAVAALEESLRAICWMYAADNRGMIGLPVLSEMDPDAESRCHARRPTVDGRRCSFLADRRARAAPGRRRPDQAADTLSIPTGFWAYDELATGRRLDVMCMRTA